MFFRVITDMLLLLQTPACGALGIILTAPSGAATVLSGEIHGEMRRILAKILLYLATVPLHAPEALIAIERFPRGPDGDAVLQPGPAFNLEHSRDCQPTAAPSPCQLLQRRTRPLERFTATAAAAAWRRRCCHKVAGAQKRERGL